MTTLAPRFLDTIQSSDFYLTQAATMTPSVMVGNNGQPVGVFGSGTRNGDLVKHFTYWNYVAISRICDRVSSVFPNIGYKTNRPMSGNQSAGILTKSQRQHLSQFRGGLIQSNEDFKPVDEAHPLVKLLKNVNPQDTWLDLVYDTHLFLQLTGEFYWWLIPSRITLPTGKKMPAQIWLIPTQFIQGCDYNEDGTVKSYTMIPNGARAYREEIPASEILYRGQKNPHDRGRGFSPIMAAPYWTLNTESIEAARSASFRNRINPSYMAVMEKDASLMQGGVNIVELIQERLMQRASGLKNYDKPLVIPPGVKDIKELGAAPREMDYGTSADQVRDQVLALHGCPKVIAGITDDVNRATVEGANVIFCENTINPKLANFGAFITEGLASIYDPNILVWFDTCTPASAEQELKEQQFDWQTGALTPNERRVERGRAPISEVAYESAYLQSSVVPLSEDVREANMERAKDMIGDPAEDTPPSGDPAKDKAKPANESDSSAEDKPAAEDKKQSADRFPGLDLL